MKKLFFVLLSFMSLTVACTRRSNFTVLKEDEVRAIMQDVSNRNRNFEPLTERDDTLMQNVVAYYEEYGTHNDLMEAYYLLGSVYRDLHEAPRAMEAFLNGISVADTLDASCRYDILARIYGQRSDILYKQRLYEKSAEEEEKVCKYATLANDTALMLDSRWGKLGKCYVMCDYQTVADECMSVLEECKRYGRFTYGARRLCTSVLANIELGRVNDADKLIRVYERYSEEVDSLTYECKFPIYYYVKGRLLTAQGKLDSAKVFFRRELHEKDWNNRQSAYRGLHEVFRREGRIDSAYKYAVLQSAAVDSDYQAMVTADLQNLHELYDYSRAQNDSHQKTIQLEKEHQQKVRVRWILSFVVLVAIFLFYYFRARYEKKIAQAELELERVCNEHEEAEYRLLELQKQLGLARSDEERAKLELEMYQAEEETAVQRKRVEDKQERLDELRHRVRLTQKNLRQRLFDEPLFRMLLRKSKEGKPATERDYADIVRFLQRKDERLLNRFYAVAPMATIIERNVFLLMRMGLTKAEIATLTSHASNSISSMVNRLYKKVHDNNPQNSAEADNWLLDL